MSGRGAVKKSRKSLSKRAGTLFPVSRIRRYLKGCTHHMRVAVGAPIYQAAVLEYLSAEILELAGNAARDHKRSRITPRHILLAIANDEELHKLLKGVTIPSGGVIPHIHPELMGRKQQDKLQIPVPVTEIKVKKASMKKTKDLSLSPKVIIAEKTGLSNSAAVVPASANPSSPVKPKAKGVSARKAAKAKGEDKGVTIMSEKTLFLGQTLSVVQGDIGKMECDAIVHPTNGSFDMSGEVGKALKEVGGSELTKAVEELHKSHGALEANGAMIGEAPNLQAKHLIHVHSPQWGQGNPEADLEKCVVNALTLADEKNMKTIAIPSIGSGSNGFPKQTAAQTILKAISNYFVTVMASSLKQVYFVLFDMESIGVFTVELAKLDS